MNGLFLLLSGIDEGSMEPKHWTYFIIDTTEVKINYSYNSIFASQRL